VTNIPNGGGSEGQRIHDLGGTPRTPRTARPKGAPAEAPAHPSLQVSARAERFVSLRARLDALEPSRAERVERLRELVASGRYQPDLEAVAEAMLADPATAASLGLGASGRPAPGA
jgi:flagellar biosynthesis anti-sigma factor FlgM